MTKRRISVSIDAELLAAAETTARRRRPANLSAWMSEAIQRQLEHEHRMEALDGFLAEFEKKFGAISSKDIAEASRWARSRALRKKAS